MADERFSKMVDWDSELLRDLREEDANTLVSIKSDFQLIDMDRDGNPIFINTAGERFIVKGKPLTPERRISRIPN